MSSIEKSKVKENNFVSKHAQTIQKFERDTLGLLALKTHFCHLAAAIVTKFFTRCFPLTRREIGRQRRQQPVKHDSDHAAVAIFYPSLLTSEQILH